MRDRLPGLRRADPSTPLDERYAVVSETRQAYQPCEVLARGAGLVLGGTTLPAMKKRVLVASNRGPVSYQFGPDGTLTGRRGGGGLVAGVAEGLAAMAPEAEVSWICAAPSDADRVAAHLRLAYPEEPGTVPVRMLDIAPDIFDRAYNNVANSILWFVQHLLFDTPNQPRFGHEFRRDWAAYLAYNEAFADAMADEAAEGSAPSSGVRALIQDYHLSLVPRLLRNKLGGAYADVGIAHFSHTPWAPP